MGSVNSASLRDEFDVYKADIASLRKEGKITKEIGVVLTGLCSLVEVLIAVFLDKTTKKTSKNSSIPPSQTDKEETRKSSKKGNYIRKCATNMFGPGFPMIIHKSTLVMKNSVSILPANPHIPTPRSAFAKLCPPLAHFRMKFPFESLDHGPSVEVEPKFSSWGKEVLCQVVDVDPITVFGNFKNG